VAYARARGRFGPTTCPSSTAPEGTALPAPAVGRSLHAGADVAATGLVVQDASGTILYANAAAGRILGLSVDQMRRLTAPDPRWRVSRADGIDLLGHEHPALAAPRASAAQRSVVRGVILPDGTRRW